MSAPSPSIAARAPGPAPERSAPGSSTPVRAWGWYPADRLQRRRIPPAQRRWVLAEGSLTAHVRARCPDRFRLQVLRQRRGRPRLDEARALGLDPRRPALLREVALCCGDEPLVVARTVIPSATLQGPRQRLARLGTRPLGALLFADRSARRGPLDIAYLTLPQAGVERPPRGAGRVWGRRAVFHLGGAPLLVSEFFLPALASAPEVTAM